MTWSRWRIRMTRMGKGRLYLGHLGGDSNGCGGWGEGCSGGASSKQQPRPRPRPKPRPRPRPVLLTTFRQISRCVDQRTPCSHTPSVYNHMVVVKLGEGLLTHRAREDEQTLAERNHDSNSCWCVWLTIHSQISEAGHPG
jgi:hypothetical protein